MALAMFRTNAPMAVMRDMFLDSQHKNVEVTTRFGSVIRAHSGVLAAASSSLRRKFASQPHDVHKMTTPDITYVTWTSLLQLLYLGAIEQHTDDDDDEAAMDDMIEAASYLSMMRLEADLKEMKSSKMKVKKLKKESADSDEDVKAGGQDKDGKEACKQGFLHVDTFINLFDEDIDDEENINETIARVENHPEGDGQLQNLTDHNSKNLSKNDQNNVNENNLEDADEVIEIPDDDDDSEIPAADKSAPEDKNQDSNVLHLDKHLLEALLATKCLVPVDNQGKASADNQYKQVSSLAPVTKKQVPSLPPVTENIMYPQYGPVTSPFERVLSVDVYGVKSCVLCAKPFGKVTQVAMHHSDVHGLTNTFYCKFCRAGFDTMKALRTHFHDSQCIMNFIEAQRWAGRNDYVRETLAADLNVRSSQQNDEMQQQQQQQQQLYSYLQAYIQYIQQQQQQQLQHQQQTRKHKITELSDLNTKRPKIIPKIDYTVFLNNACHLCPTVAADAGQIIHHMKHAHRSASPEVSCRVCQQRFSAYTEFVEHVHSQHIAA